jgi:hypothetical protein
MKLYELLIERRPTEDEMKLRGWDGDKESAWAVDHNVPSARSPVGFTSMDAIRDILGNNVTDNEDNISAGQYYVYNSAEPMFRSTGKTNAEGGSIAIRDMHSNSAADIAEAVHEAYHAWLHSKSHGNVYTNEKMVNQLAATWLKKHLSGHNLHVAIESILQSKINYGHN